VHFSAFRRVVGRFSFRVSPQFDDVASGTPRLAHAFYDAFIPHIALDFSKGNFGGNQLLNDSIGLSPLYSSLTNDLHVSTAYDLPPRFLLASAYSSIARRFSGPNMTCSNSNPNPKARLGER
jgi:hypothetical protein